MNKRGCGPTFLAVLALWLVFFLVCCPGKATGAVEEPTGAVAEQVIRALVLAADGNEWDPVVAKNATVDVSGIDHLAGINTELVLALDKPEEPELVSLGVWKITHYCCEAYEHICGDGDGLTATGEPVRPGIVAVDPRVIPYGSIVVIDGVEYLAADCGGSIKGQRIDIAVLTHEEALERGVRYLEVFIKKEESRDESN